MAQPVRADLVRPDPGQMFAQALPQVVVTAVGNRRTVSVPEHAVLRMAAAAIEGVLAKTTGQCWRDGLPSHSLTLLLQLNNTLVKIDVSQAKRESTPTPTGSLDVETQQETI